MCLGLHSRLPYQNVWDHMIEYTQAYLFVADIEVISMYKIMISVI